MEIILLCILVLAIFTPFAEARPDEPIPYWPKWATQECMDTIGSIVQHETGSMKDDAVFRFMAEQVIYDIQRMGCKNLTQWRWKIGPYSSDRISAQVAHVVIEAVADYPNMIYPRCQFIGSVGDIAVWRNAGYKISVDYRLVVGGLTVVGANCR